MESWYGDDCGPPGVRKEPLRGEVLLVGECLTVSKVGEKSGCDKVQSRVQVARDCGLGLVPWPFMGKGCCWGVPAVIPFKGIGERSPGKLCCVIPGAELKDPPTTKGVNSG